MTKMTFVFTNELVAQLEVISTRVITNEVLEVETETDIYRINKKALNYYKIEK